jgi:surface protein
MPIVLPPNASDWGIPASPAPYERPTDWLTFTAPSGSEEKFVGIFGVWNAGSNYCALLCRGNYTVDWGDGSSPEDVNSDVTAEHLYSWSSLSSGTVTSRGYRQALITVTPQAGQHLTRIDLQQVHSRTGLPSNCPTMWLEIAINAPNLTSVYLCDSTVPLNSLEIATLTNIGSITNLSYLFYGAKSLRRAAVHGTSSATNMEGLFNECWSLVDIVELDTSSATNVQAMFTSCRSLRSIPYIDTSHATNMGGMFGGCVSLQDVPLLNTSSVTGMWYMFNGCSSLRSVPLFNTSIVTGFGYMFGNCFSLTSIPLFDTSSATNLEGMFQNCYNFNTIPLFDTSKVTNTSYMFNGCSMLQTIPLLDTSSVTNMEYMFNLCLSLQKLPALNVALVTNFGSSFSSGKALMSSPISGATVSLTISNVRLARADIVDIFNALGTASGTQTIDVTGNHGYADLTAGDKQIATDKGWTVA